MQLRLNKLLYIDTNKENQLLYEKAFKSKAKNTTNEKTHHLNPPYFTDEKCVLSFAKINVKPDLGAF